MNEGKPLTIFYGRLLAGVMALPPESIGPYIVVAALLRARGERLGWDLAAQRQVARVCGAKTVRTLGKWLDPLFASGKLMLVDGVLVFGPDATEFSRRSESADHAEGRGR